MPGDGPSAGRAIINNTSCPFHRTAGAAALSREQEALRAAKSDIDAHIKDYERMKMR